MNDEMHKKINEVNELFQRLLKEIPDLMEPFGELVNQSLKDGKLDTKTKEIIMVILALSLIHI